jgi:hypothetical protein
MSDDATETNIPDKDAALWHLRQMGVQADDLKSSVAGIVQRIDQLESDKPWGHTPEYRDPFEKVYFAGNGAHGGPKFVRDNVTILADETKHGAAMADWALSQSVDLDMTSASMYEVKDSGTVGAGLTGTDTAMGNAQQQQQDQQKADQ